jgi:arsenite-transporting ATPase
MSRIEVFEPALCCATGVCGVDVDQGLVTFSADLDFVRTHGGDVSRFNLASEPLAFATNHAVQTFLQVAGSDGLPLVLVDGVTAMTGRYPDRAQLVAWSGVKASVSTGPAMLPITETGSPGTGCCSNDGSDTTCC